MGNGVKAPGPGRQGPCLLRVTSWNGQTSRYSVEWFERLSPTSVRIKDRNYPTPQVLEQLLKAEVFSE